MTCHRHIQHPRDSVTAPGLSRPHGCGRGDPWGARRSPDRTPLPRVNQHQNFVLPANYRGSFPADPPGDGDESGETLAEFHLQDVLSCSVLACPRTFLLLLCPIPSFLPAGWDSGPHSPHNPSSDTLLKLSKSQSSVKIKCVTAATSPAQGGCCQLRRHRSHRFRPSTGSSDRRLWVSVCGEHGSAQRLGRRES